MSVVNLEYLFNPKSVAVIGATNKPNNIGNIVMKNIMGGGFLGPVMPVSQEADAIAGVLTYAQVADLPKVPDLAIVCRPVAEAPEIIDELRLRGTHGVMLLGSDIAKLDDDERQSMRARILEAANFPDVRVLGPKCLGFISPHLSLNASLAHTTADPGRIAFITQSDSLLTTVLDWAKGQNIGFSHLVALGSRIDVTIADVLDYLSSDAYTRAILLYVESVCDARDFMSAGRAASRNKPVLVIRPGQAIETVLRECKDIDLEGMRLADEIYDVAFRRAGMLRVDNIDELFDGARTLADVKPVRGDRLAIVTNGDSAGIMAADSLLMGGGRLAQLSEETRASLDAITGASWSRSNPVSIPFDASGEQYAETVKALLKDKGVDAVLAMHVPFAGLDGAEVARGLAASLRRVRRMVLTSWLGTGAARGARDVFHEAGVPTYDTPDKAIRAYLFMVEYQKNQEMLIETPASLPSDFFPDTTTARKIVTRALAEGREGLTEPESKDVLASYGIPAVETRITVSARDAVIAADELGYPVALKLRSPQIAQPLEVGGVLLDLETPEQVWDAAAGMLARVSRERPDAYIEGFTVQKMGRRPGAHELFISAKVDPVFGPVIHFGHGGMSRDMVRDRAVALPPLSMSLARELVGRTRIAKLLPGTPT
ncbi:MAG: acetate--CoA ligase family protein, partial [Desulfovibrionaceae bacterium]